MGGETKEPIIKIENPLYDMLANEVSAAGRAPIAKAYGQADTNTIITSTIDGLLKSPKAEKFGIKADIEKKEIVLTGDNCRIDFQAHIDTNAHVSGDIGVEGTLANGGPGIIWREEPNINISKVLNATIHAAGKGGEIQTFKENPQQALEESILDQLKIREVEAQIVTMKLENSTFIVVLRKGKRPEKK